MALSSKSLLALAISTSLLCSAGSALAKKGGGGGGGGGSMNQPRPQPRPVNPAIAQDQQAISSARSELAKAQSILDTSTSKATSTFETSAEVVAAKKAVADAQAATDAARAVMAKLTDDPAHKSAADAEAAAEKKLDTLKATDGTTQDQIGDQATLILKLGSATSKIERDALDADQPFQDAQAKLTAATKALADLRTAFKAGLKTDPTIGPLMTARDDAQAKVTAAIAKLSSDSSSASAY